MEKKLRRQLNKYSDHFEKNLTIFKYKNYAMGSTVNQRLSSIINEDTHPLIPSENSVVPRQNIMETHIKIQLVLLSIITICFCIIALFFGYMIFVTRQVLLELTKPPFNEWIHSMKFPIPGPKVD